MATEKEINNLLKELGITEVEMQKIYDELASIDKHFSKIKASGLNWNDLNIYTIRDISKKNKWL